MGQSTTQDVLMRLLLPRCSIFTYITNHWTQALVSATPPPLPVNNVLKKILEGPLGGQAWSLQGPEGGSPDISQVLVSDTRCHSCSCSGPFPVSAERPRGSPVVALTPHLAFSRGSFCYNVLAVAAAPLFSTLTYISLQLLSLDY